MMLRLLIVSTLLVSSSLAYNYGGRKGYQDSSYQTPEAAPAPVAPVAPTYSKPKTTYQPVSLPVNSARKVQYVDVESSNEEHAPLAVNVPAPLSTPVKMTLHSRSSPMDIESAHQGAPGTYKETSSEDAPHVRRHTVIRPVYHEVHEIITPYRRVHQQIQPVQEQAESLVAREQSPVPVYQKPAYVAPKPVQPVYSQPKYSQPKKVQAPVYQKPKVVQPVYSQPKPAYSQPKPTYTQPKPAYAPKPTYAQPKPTYAQPKPTYTQPKPQAPVYQKPAAPKPAYKSPVRQYQENNY